MIKLADKTAFGVGGYAESYHLIKNSSELIDFIKDQPLKQTVNVFGSGTNLLVADDDLSGVTIQLQGGIIEAIGGRSLRVDAGVNWDDLVQKSIDANLFGIEMLSGIPGTVGAAAMINISAYGQHLSDSLDWVEVIDRQTASSRRLDFNPKDWGYKRSPFSSTPTIISRIGMTLNQQPINKILYPSIVDHMNRNNLPQSDLKSRRLATLAVREKAGSIYVPGKTKNCGSFFKNPVVKQSIIKQIVQSDETNLTMSQIKLMNKVHNRQPGRISATHVLLASGFVRGQKFGKVRLHPDHVLKLDNYQNGSSEDIYKTARFIQKTVWDKFKIKLQFEVSLWGEFN